MTDYGESLGGGLSTFSESERINHTLKLSLGKIQTDVSLPFYSEPTQLFRKDTKTIYRNQIPEYIGNIENYIVVDTRLGETDTTPYIVANPAVSGQALTVRELFNSFANFSLTEILDTNDVRNHEVTFNTGDLVNVNVNSQTIQAMPKPSRAMFARYMYWRYGLTGLASRNANYTSNPSGTDYIQNTTDGVGTYNSSQNLAYNESNNAQEPFNGYITVDSSAPDDASSSRRLEIFQSAITSFKNGTTTDAYRVYQLFQSVYPGISIIDPDLITGQNISSILYDKVKAHLSVPTFTSWNGVDNEQSYSSGQSVTTTDTLAFLNPLAQDGLGEAQGFPNTAQAYRIIYYDDTTGQKRYKNAPLSYGSGDSLIFLAESGVLVSYGNTSYLTGDKISVINPPFLSYFKYVGEKFSDGVIQQGELTERPNENVTVDKDLFIDTTNNVLYRAGTDPVSGDKTWIAVGGSSQGGGSGQGYWYSEADAGDIPNVVTDIVYGVDPTVNATTSSPGDVMINSSLKVNHAFFGAGYKTESTTGTLSQFAGDANVTVNGLMAASSIVVTENLDMVSDARLKKNIVPLENSLSAISCIQPVSFDWKNGDGKHNCREIGFIAQNIQTVYPQLVHITKGEVKNSKSSGASSEKFLSVNYIGMIPVLCSAIKEQQEVIDELKQEMQMIKNRLLDSDRDGGPKTPKGT